MNTIVIDATNAILGRLASYAAKQSLLGNNIIIVNCNDAVVSGKRLNIQSEYHEARVRGGASLKGPNFPKIPERLVKRTIRGMLSYKQGRGEAAFDRVKCYNSLPAEYTSKKQTIQSISGENKPIKTMKLSELAKII